MLFLHDTCRVDNCKEQPRNACHILHRQRVRQLHPSRHHVPAATMRQLPIQDCTTTGGRGYQSPKQPHKYGTRQLVCRPGISTKLLPTATSYDATSQATTASAAAQTSLQQPTINRSQSRATSKTATRTSHRAPRQVQKALSNRVSKNDNRTH